MTRINSDLEPSKLTDQHLIAEYRELPMVISSLRKSLRTRTKQDILRRIPKNFTLGTGHVLFFMNKLIFLEKRYQKLIEEMKKRGFSPDPTRVLDFTGLPSEFFNDWVSEETDEVVIKERIKTKIMAKFSFYRFWSTPITESWFLKFI